MPWYQPHAECSNRACISRSYLDEERFCSVAKCLDASDCPTGWYCRCDEELKTEGLKAYRWCVPDEAPDAGAPADAGLTADAGLAADAGEHADAGEAPDAGESSDGGNP
jgi:hypothetical protein